AKKPSCMATKSLSPMPLGAILTGCNCLADCPTIAVPPALSAILSGSEISLRAAPQQRRIECAGNCLLAFSGAGGVADHDDALVGARQMEEPRRSAAARFEIKPIPHCRRFKDWRNSRRSRKMSVEQPIGKWRK